MIQWKNNTNTGRSFIADAGDLRLILQKKHTCWQLLISIRVYTQDRKRSMIRPSVAVTKFDKDCSVEEAQHLAYKFIQDFIYGITKAIT